MKTTRRLSIVAASILVEGAIIMPAFAAPTAYNQKVLNDSPAYYWTFDEVGVVNAVEQVNGLAADAFVPGVNATKLASATADSGVSLGQAVRIQGTGGYTWNVADLSGGGMTGAFAYELVARADDVSSYEYILGSNAVTGFNTGAILKWGSTIQLHSAGGVGPGAPVTPGWHHYVFVTAGASADVDAYIDGVFWGTFTSNQPHPPHVETALKLGGWTDGAHSEVFDGMIDELAIYDLAGVSDLQAAGQAIASHWIPEPSTFTLSLIGFALIARRRRKK